MAGATPTVMISSTFYDLAYIRREVANFITTELGYRALVSESSSFPLDPDLGTLDLCRKRVEDDADILVLIMGLRYGSIDERYGKSITNIEYLTARHKGIPIYAFMTSDLIAGLESADKHDDNADPRLIAFAKEVRDEDGVWVFGFADVAEIISCIREQFAHLFALGLLFRRKLASATDSTMESLPSKAMDLAVYTPIGWEYEFFGELLRHETETRLDLRDRYDLKLSGGPSITLPIEAVPRWVNEKMQHAMGLVADLGILMNERLQEALGAPGASGDRRSIARVARQCGVVYEDAIRWVLDMRRMLLESDLKEGVQYIERALDDVIVQVGKFGLELSTDIAELREWSKKHPGEKVERNFTLSITTDQEALNLGWDKIQRAFRERGYSV
jgi:hypothetical protein